MYNLYLIWNLGFCIYISVSNRCLLRCAVNFCLFVHIQCLCIVDTNYNDMEDMEKNGDILMLFVLSNYDTLVDNHRSLKN